MDQRKNYLKRIEYINTKLPEMAEDNVLYVVSAELFTSAYLPDGFPAVVYNDLLKSDGSFFEGVKYVLEGEGEFDPEEFDDDYLENIYRRLKRIPWDILETQRCLIRETSINDLDAFYEIYSDPEITRFTENLMERSEEEKYTENYRDCIYEVYGHGIWTVVLKETGEIIGRAGLDERAGFDTPELGFVIGKKWQRQGLAYEACNGILKWAADNGMKDIMSLTDQDNTASVNLLKKLGFSRHNKVYISGEELDRYMMVHKT